MKKILLMSIVLLLTTISSFCQSTYPQKLVINKDTIVAISPFQLRSINVFLIERNTYKETVGESKLRMEVLNKNLIKASILNEEKTKLITLQSQQIEDLKNLSGNCDQAIEAMKKEISNQKRKKFRSTTVAVLITATVTTAVVALIK